MNRKFGRVFALSSAEFRSETRANPLAGLALQAETRIDHLETPERAKMSQEMSGIQ